MAGGASSRDSRQTALPLDDERSGEAEPATGAEAAPAGDVSGNGSAPPEEVPPAMQPTMLPAGPPVIELGHDRAGCWKVTEAGGRVALSEAEWRQELARLLAKG
ncbi:MAG: hypothetical protein HY423_06600 [Candidatus Lambdaproteobacteria bacterium]|nr:hypothetical protein [Candidatus Lambdaproteobacteria bacterium]